MYYFQFLPGKLPDTNNKPNIWDQSITIETEAQHAHAMGKDLGENTGFNIKLL